MAWVSRPLLVYSLAAAVMTWPLVLHPASRLAAPVGPGDPFLNLWILGWGMQTILTDPLALVTGRVFDANIFHPASGTLAYSDHLLLQGALLAPLYAATRDVVLCYNVLFAASLVASALAMHAFVRSVVGAPGGAYLAGLAWGFGSYRFAHLVHLQLQSLYFLPLAFLCLHRLIAGRRRRDAITLGIVAGLQAVSSVYYAVIGGVALACGAVPLALMSSRRRNMMVARRLVLAAVVGGGIVAPVAFIYWRVQQGEGFGRNLFEASRNAAYVDSYVQVPPGNVLYGRTGLLRHNGSPVDGRPPRTGPERELFPGVVIAALALVGAWRGWRGDGRPVVATMIVVAGVGFVLSLGPDGIRPAYAVFHDHVFGFQAIRAPARFAVLVTFGLSTLAALGWREWANPRSVSRGGGILTSIGAPLLLVGVFSELLHVPEMLAPAPPGRTEAGEWLRRESLAGAVVVLPVGLDVESTPAMVQSLEHRRPLVNGYSGQRPAFYVALAESLNAFPSEEALLAMREADVRFVVTPVPVRVPTEYVSPIVERARLAGVAIYELRWTADTEAALERVSGPPPMPPGPSPFSPGEAARYAVAWGGAGMNLVAGEIAVRVEPPAYRFVVEAQTAPWMARFFRARELFVTSTGADLLPQVHERDQQEGSRHVHRAFVYDHEARVVRTGPSPEEAAAGRGLALPLAPFGRDAISALFYARSLPLETGATYSMPINEAGRTLRVELSVVGREAIQVQGRSLTAIRLDPRVQQRMERRRPVAATLWLSADERRVPLAMDLEAAFGRVRVELIDYERGR
jgi:hypothetical protein